MRMIRLAIVALLLAVPSASAAPRMLIGFYDDNSFRWSPDAAKNLLAAEKAGASIIHVTADWSQIAPTKPASPLNGDDPAYRISDLDALVADAGRYGLQVMINISGAPKWANGGQPSNNPPPTVPLSLTASAGPTPNCGSASRRSSEPMTIPAICWTSLP